MCIKIFWVFWILSMTMASTVVQAVTVSSVAELSAAIRAAHTGGDKTINIAAGIYNLHGTFFRITADGVKIGGVTGRRADVVLDGNYETTEIFQIQGSNVMLRNMTLRRALYHPIHIFPDTKDVVGTLISNLYILDPGQQAVKINQNSAKTFSVNFGRVTGSKIELSENGRTRVWQINGSCYTGGVDAHHAAGWRIDNNIVEGFWCAGGLAEHGVHFWSFSQDTLVEKNRIINCDRGIGFGLGGSGHTGGVIRNNFIFHNTGHDYSDVGIGLESASDVQVYNNTIYHQHAYPNAIEYRFTTTHSGDIQNNLTNKAIVSRNGGSAALAANVTLAQQGWFVDADSGDLHLATAISSVMDRGVFISELQDDIDGEARPLGKGVDIGADEWLQVSRKAPVLTWLNLVLGE